MGLARWKKYTADMSDSEPYKQLRDQSTALKGDNGEILGVPFVIESYGLIYNKDLLNKYFQATGRPSRASTIWSGSKR